MNEAIIATGTAAGAATGAAAGTAAGAAPDATLTINGVPVPAAGTLLDACAAAGAPVPHLCHSDRVRSGGHCRTCIVEADGRHVPACTAPARPGQRVLTDTDRLRAYRRDLGELMRAEAAPGGAAADWLRIWGVTGERYGAAGAAPAGAASAGAAPGIAPKITAPARDASHPYLRLLPEA